jgi:8-oxo-dGTP pyrophosphatase MutT (NUDIX family)
MTDRTRSPGQRKWPARPRDAASVVVLRGHRDNPEVLLGRRRLDARFMPGVYVFPGGRVDPSDAAQGAGLPLRHDVLAKMSRHCPPRRARALVWAAIRETWEETGLLIGEPGEIDDDSTSPLHAAYAAAKLRPASGQLDYILRAITPARSPIRFNTRFFLADGEVTSGKLEHTTELEDIGWRSAAEALKEYELMTVTRLALNEAVDLWRENPPPDPDRPVKRMFNRKSIRLISTE